MKLCLVRSGYTDWDFDDIIVGSKNMELCDDGRRRLNKLKEKIKDKTFDYCYMSPALRCVETAIILVGDRVETIPDKRLIDRNYGMYEGTIINDEIKMFWDIKKDIDLENVEKISLVIERVKDFLDYIKNKYSDNSCLLIVSDVSIINVINMIVDKKYKINYKIDSDYYLELDI